MKVYIAVGHGETPQGRHDPGAVAGKVTEQTSGDVIVDEASSVVAAAGVDVIDEAFTDDPNFSGTVAAANAAKVDLVVSVHHDWSGGVDAAHGFWFPGSTRGEAVTRSILDAVTSAGFDVDPRWIKPRSDLYLLKRTVAPTTLIEVGRIGDDSLDTDDERRAMGRAIGVGILEYLGVDAPAPAPKPTPEPEPKPKPTDNWTESLVKNLPLLKRRNDLDRASAADRRAQGLLAAAGVLPIGPNLDGGRFDGKFGESTEKAVYAFQRRAGLSEDGIIGRNTWTALLGG